MRVKRGIKGINSMEKAMVLQQYTLPKPCILHEGDKKSDEIT